MPPKKKNLLKELKTTVTQYNNQVSKCNVLLNGRKYEKYNDVQKNLEDKFDLMCQAWESYKEELTDQGVSEDQFNSLLEDGSGPVHTHNDSWKNGKEAAFFSLYERLSDAKPEPKDNAVEVAKLQVLCQEIKLLLDLISSTTDKLFEDVAKMEDSKAEESLLERFIDLINVQRIRINQELAAKLRSRMELSDNVTDAACSKDVLFQQISEFSKAQLEKLDTVQFTLAYKIKPKPSPSVVSASSAVSHHSADRVQLAKTKPPYFKGDVIEYPEFKRKWNALVHAASLPIEAELDKLRDALPKSAKDQLCGCKTLVEAWGILDKRYGNPDLIAKKLKDQLKTVKPEGKSDPERVINLHVKVRSLVVQLTTMNMQQSLKYDPEFLGAVYNCLPVKFQDKWLDLNKSSFDTKWDAMISFLDTVYDQATEQLILLDTMGKVDHKKRDVVDVHTVHVQSDRNKEDNTDDVELRKKKEKRKKVKEEIGPCPNCKLEHTFVRRDKLTWPSDRFFTCKKFKDMSVQERGRLLEMVNGCIRCTSWRHNKASCPSQIVKCSADKPDGSKCGRDHSFLVHNSGIAYCNVAKSYQKAISTNKQVAVADYGHVDTELDIVYYLEDIPVKNSADVARCFYDEGSNRVLIRDDFAKSAGLVAQKVTWKLQVVGQTDFEIVEGNIYLAELIDINGKLWKIWGYGISSIMTSDVPSMKSLKRYFPHVPDNALEGLAMKEVDILLGLNMNHLFPAGGVGTDKHQGMKAKRSLFGCGWVLGGWHKDLSVCHSEFTQDASIMRSAKLQIAPSDSLEINFWEAENMAVLPPPKCERCITCYQTGTCSERNRLVTAEQQAELEVIESKTDIIDNVVWCAYPYKKDPVCLKFNRNAALKVEEKVERDLLKSGHHSVYNEQVQAILDRNAAVQLTNQELEEWAGPINYVTHHPVYKDSASTPVRMVTNSSFGSPSLNSILMKGPNALNSMLDIMIRWRSWDVVIQYDLSKAYNTMHTGLTERHLRRFLWRFDPGGPWLEFSFDRVHFGDVPAACQLEVALHKIADLGKEISQLAADKLKHDRYVDDGLTGGSADVVKQLVGVKSDDGNYTGDLAKILKLGSFNIKALLIGGQMPTEETNLMGNTVLGYGYNVKREVLSVKFPMNLSQKKRGVRLEANLSMDDLDMLKTRKLSKRMLLGITNSFGDFLGIASPFVIRFKVLMRKLFQLDPPLHWDNDIPQSLRLAWINLIVEALEHGDLEFNRSCKPVNALPGMGPIAVGFADFAEEAYEARVYLRWEIESSCDERQFSSQLCLCKAKVPPLEGLTTPRGELTALCLLSRLVLVVITALQKLDFKPTSCVMLVDSQCSINVVDSNKLMKPYFQNRVAEIKENMLLTSKLCEMEDIFYVESKLNPSDISTRATSKLNEIGPGSFHQCGPIFLSLPREEWPVTRKFDKKNIPEEEFKMDEIKSFHSKILPVEVPELMVRVLGYSESILKVQRLLARVLRLCKLRSITYIKTSQEEPTSSSNKQLLISKPNTYRILSMIITADELIEAEHTLLVCSMAPTYVALEKGHLDSLLPQIDGDLVVTRGRLGDNKMLELFGSSSLPILMPQSRLAYLYMLDAHRGEYGMVHRGVSSTLARSRSKVWVIRGNRLAKKICESCIVCRRIAKKLIGQQMALIREEQLEVTPPFTHICLDFTGPVKVVDQISKRKTLKVWILVYVCVSTKAVVLLATPGYATEDFLCKHDEFTARFGRPKTIVSDKGSQLVRSSVKVEEKDKPSNSFNWSHIVNKDAKTRWIFVPEGGQHRNGLAESTVKVIKRSLNLALQKGQILAYAELVTLLARISTSVNSRPLSISRMSSSSGQDDVIMPVTPNHLLLGRSTSEPVNLNYTEGDKFSRRMVYIQNLQDEWWKLWIREVLPTLVPCKRWKFPKRNLQVNDIVMVTFPGNMTDEYRVAKVVKVFPDKNNLVRTVDIAYRCRNRREPAAAYKSAPLVVEEGVHVQKLSLLQAADESIWDGESCL